MLSNKIAEKISAELGLDEERQAVINYGAFAVIQIFISLALVIIFGMLLGLLPESLIISFSINILRQYSGGAHASKPSICLLISTVVTIFLAFTAHWIGHFASGYVVLTVGLFIFLWAYYEVYKNAPVDSKAKPITTEKKKAKMRKFSFVILTGYFIIALILVLFSFTSGRSQFLSYSFSLYAGVTWQIVTLTITGRKILNNVDRFLDKFLFFGKE